MWEEGKEVREGVGGRRRWVMHLRPLSDSVLDG